MADITKRARKRCAIYTRKSSEEGPDQEFNSLQAQREACEAFIASQKSEGWQVLKASYDDGGWSGGTNNHRLSLVRGSFESGKAGSTRSWFSKTALAGTKRRIAASRPSPAR